MGLDVFKMTVWFKKWNNKNFWRPFMSVIFLYLHKIILYQKPKKVEGSRIGGDSKWVGISYSFTWLDLRFQRSVAKMWGTRHFDTFFYRVGKSHAAFHLFKILIHQVDRNTFSTVKNGNIIFFLSIKTKCGYYGQFEVLEMEIWI